MKYFKNTQNEVYAYEIADLEHDEQVKLRIAELEAEKLNPPMIEEGEEAKDYDAIINQLRSTIRISDQLIAITEQEMQQLTAPSAEELERQFIESEHAWVKFELDSVQVELMYHWTDDERASSTEEAWKQYARDLRNYTTTYENGTPSIRTDARPIKPI
ncbi:hypothetical protein VCV51_030649 [Vibrio cholerae V51]|uniref:hypothetical protein n=1 Tax=Vibrio cholerae TaxID=666 RepID=UPI00005F4643|nr:hypothetical protein [Vibrio cholerae]EGR0074856.1 hypothetical protein [Vibrio cholerae]EJL6958849.1 hypothetical protein [Vibrio cholerae]EMC8698666.1 hypothetical protein [Vibrio cholerae]KFD95184.1 putative chromosome segregation ATPase [Vibrio cholerae]KNA56326.1 hypothetical protein VCV51_030649 [Vibrio cholerae V51]